MAFGVNVVKATKQGAKNATVKKIPPPRRSGATEGHGPVIKGYAPQTPTVYTPAARRSIQHGRQIATRERTRKALRASQRRSRQTKRAVRTAEPPKTYKGRKTVGAPSLPELKKAQATATLKTNKAGYLTTPKVRKTLKSVSRAKKAVQHSTAVEGPLVPEQKRFVKGVAKHTGLAPRAVAAQALAEESGSAAQGYEGSGEHNYLNIGPGQHYGSNREAVKATSELLNKSSNYAGIRASRGTGARNQIQAIAASPWGTVGSTMEGTLPLVHAKSAPKAEKRLAKAEENAKELGLKTQGNVGPAPKQIVKKYKAALAAIKQVNAKHFEYSWGGGHAGFEGPFDCSGAISYMLHRVGDLSTPLTSGNMGQALQPGKGAITVFYNGEHTFAYIAPLHKYWGTSESNPGGGAGFFPKSVGDSEVASGNAAGAYSVGHVPGLDKKAAFQLGATGLGAGQPFPGMTLSPSGTSASITGASATQGKPGFSNKPIRLTPLQKVRRAKRQLKAIRGPEGASQTEVKSTTLKSLEEKYGVKT